MNYENIEKLKSLSPCSEAIDWFSEQQTPEQAWRDCQRGDWMLWLVGKVSGNPGSDTRRKMIFCCCECARLSAKVKHGILRAIETVERWAKGDTTIELQDAAASAAYGNSAAAATAAAYAAYAAVKDAMDAANVTNATDAVLIENSIMAICADIVRKHYPQPPEVLICNDLVFSLIAS